MQQILVIDTDIKSCDSLVGFLAPKGFNVETVSDSYLGLKHAISGRYSLIIMDVFLPGMTGFDLLRNIRISSQVPVLILSKKGSDSDRIQGLEMGADDYLLKPVVPRELIARINAIQRRNEPQGKHIPPNLQSLQQGDIVLDFHIKAVKQNTHDIKVTRIEFELLSQLLKNAGQVISRSVLSKMVLNREFDTFDRSIDVHISNLRKKLGQTFDGHEKIQTVRGVGYLYNLASINA